LPLLSARDERARVAKVAPQQRSTRLHPLWLCGHQGHHPCPRTPPSPTNPRLAPTLTPVPLAPNPNPTTFPPMSSRSKAALTSASSSSASFSRHSWRNSSRLM
jgi:hypothetical protein